MNENIDLTKILKDCPEGTEFWSKVHGRVTFVKIDNHAVQPITIRAYDDTKFYITKNGKYFSSYEGECILVPSKDQQDWSKLEAPWYKKEKFDPKTLQPFDKVLVRPNLGAAWLCTTFSYTY